MDLAKKLQLRPGQHLDAVQAPASLTTVLESLRPPVASDADAALLVFVLNRAVLDEHRANIVTSALADHLTWVAYPKAGQLNTDLNRDTLASALIASELQPVRQIAIDEVWSALRFRPGA